MIDTHCHLTHARLAAEEGEVLNRAAAAGVRRVVTIGTGVADARDARELAKRHPGSVLATAGLDPFSAHRAGDAFDEEFDHLAALLREGGFVAVGEIGLDYHYDLDPRPVQRARFERQLELAEDLGLPVVVHVREAHDDMAAVLADHPAVRGVIHSFTAGPREAERYLELGWMLAFNGVLTFPGAPEVRDAARIAPLDRVVIETDAPYLAPVPHRGTRCEPALVVHTLAKLADLRQLDREEMARLTDDNATRLFRIS